jgi:hypothetical protein
MESSRHQGLAQILCPATHFLFETEKLTSISASQFTYLSSWRVVGGFSCSETNGSMFLLKQFVF